MLLLVSASIILFSGVRSSRFDVRCLSDAVSPFILLQPATDGALGLPRHPTHSRFLLRGGFASSCTNPPLRGRSRQCQILFVFLPFSEASSAALASFVRCSSMQLHRAGCQSAKATFALQVSGGIHAQDADFSCAALDYTRLASLCASSDRRPSHFVFHRLR